MKLNAREHVLFALVLVGLVLFLYTSGVFTGSFVEKEKTILEAEEKISFDIFPESKTETSLKQIEEIKEEIGILSILTGCMSINSPGAYTATGNIFGNISGGVCVDISSDDVIIDCNNYFITGTYAGTTYGVKSGGHTNITIRNCVINNYSYGIYFEDVNNSEIKSNIVYNNSVDGIYMYASDNNTLLFNSVYTNRREGIFLDSGCDDNTLFDNFLYDNVDYGIKILSSSRNNVTKNIATLNLVGGFLLSFAQNTNLTDNKAENNFGNGGFILATDTNTRMINNIAINNSVWDYESGSSVNVYAENFTFNNTKTSFIHDGDLRINSSISPAKSPSGYSVLGPGYYLEISNISASWIYLNISYDDSDVSGIESTLRLWKYSGDWNQNVGDTNDVDTVNNRVYANITNLSSVFTPMAENTDISSCKKITIPNKVYHMVQNITNNQSSGVCIDIQADNITLDCAGYKIYNTTGLAAGIVILDASNVSITNCKIDNAEGAVYIYNSSDVELTNSVINKSSYYNVWIKRSDNISVDNNLFIGPTESDSVHSSVLIENTTNLVFSNNNIINSSGIGLKIINITSTGNNFTNNRILNSTLWDFVSDSSSNNLITNLTLNKTAISFELDGNINIKHKVPTTANNNPSGYINISHYLNITNSSADAWIYLNISYSDTDIAEIKESSLRIWKNASGGWSQNLNLTGALVSGVNTADNYVYANISNFSSIFAPLGLERMRLTVIAPTNTTYTSSSILFRITTSKNASVCLYNLDSKGNATMSNSSLTSWTKQINNLAESQHNVTFWCNDTTDDSAGSGIIYFTVNLKQGGGGGTDAGRYTAPSTVGPDTAVFLFPNIPANVYSGADSSNPLIDIIRIIIKPSGVINGQITVKQLSGKPSDASAPEDSVYRYFLFTPSNLPYSMILDAEIHFRVLKSWADGNNVDADSITLYRYANNWQKLSTEKTGEDNSYYYFKASTTAFSYFAITGKAVVAPAKEEALPLTPAPMPICGDGICDISETSFSCPSDCPGLTAEEKEKGVNLLLVGGLAAAGLVAAALAVFFVFIKPRLEAEGEALPVLEIEIRPEKEHMLEAYIRKAIRDGHSQQAIISALLKVGWTEEQIETAFELAMVPPQKEEAIIEWAQRQLKRGFTNEQMQQKLLSVGWSSKEAKHTIKMAQKSMVKS